MERIHHWDWSLVGMDQKKKKKKRPTIPNLPSIDQTSKEIEIETSIFNRLPVPLETNMSIEHHSGIGVR
jgi:hypothetical protein